MKTLNREKSLNVIKLPTECKCIACGHSISFASKTYFEQTKTYIGLDCWEKEKEAREEARIAKIKASKEVQLLEDKKSRFLSSIGVKVQLQVKLEKVKFMYKSSFGYSEVETYLNFFRDEEGNIITYMGKNLFWDYLTLFGFTYEIDYDGDWLTQQAVNESLIQTMQIDIKTAYNTDGLPANKAQYVKDEKSTEVFIIKNPKFVSLTGTIKNHNEFNGIKQTQVQRPKLTK